MLREQKGIASASIIFTIITFETQQKPQIAEGFDWAQFDFEVPSYMDVMKMSFEKDKRLRIKISWEYPTDQKMDHDK